MDYTWVYLSFLSAVMLASSDALTKKSVESCNEYLVAWFRLLLSLPPLLIIVFFIPFPSLDREFYLAFSIALPVELLTVVLYVKALKVSPMGLTLPFLAITPLVLIIFSLFRPGETVSAAGGAGIVLIASGSYMLNIRHVRHGLFEPFRAIGREAGSVMMICVALCYAVTSTMGKIAIEHSSPLFFSVTYTAALVIFLAPISLLMGRREIPAFVSDRRFRTMIISGLFYSAATIFHMEAMKLTKVAYMVSVKRSSLLIGVFYGYLFFKEKGTPERAVGALLMFSGFVLLVNGG